MHPQLIVVCLLMAAGLFGAGYACRGWIRREIGVGRQDVLGLATRLENALISGGKTLESEAAAVIAAIRKL